MMLCGVSVVINSLGDVLGLMSRKRSSENGQLLVGFQSTEAFGCLHHAGGGPAQRHRGISPPLHVATDATHGPHHVLDRVGAGERAPEFYRQAEAVDGQHLVEPFEDTGGDSGRGLVKPTGEIAQQPLGFIGIIKLPSLPERPAYRRMQRLGQPLDHVAGFMNLTALDRRVGAEGATDDFAQRLGAVDDEQPADLGIKPALDQVVLIGEHRMSGEKKYYLANLSAKTDLRTLAATIKARR